MLRKESRQHDYNQHTSRTHAYGSQQGSGTLLQRTPELRRTGRSRTRVTASLPELAGGQARKINLTLVHEMTIRGRIRPDGVLCDAFHIQRGYWEAKGPRGNLEEEIRQKIKGGYPLENALFENTRQAVLYQAGQRYDFDLRVQADATTLLKR